MFVNLYIIYEKQYIIRSRISEAKKLNELTDISRVTIKKIFDKLRILVAIKSEETYITSFNGIHTQFSSIERPFPCVFINPNGGRSLATHYCTFAFLLRININYNI